MTSGKMNLLQLTQKVLEKMESDEVSSIFDTVESQLVASEIQDSFYNMIFGIEDYHRQEYITLEGLSDASYPNILKIPEQVIVVKNIWYGLGAERTEIDYIDAEEFVFKTMSETAESVSYLSTPNSNAAPLSVRYDKSPQSCTSFDNRHLFFDSYDAATEQTLQASKSSALVISIPEFKMDDTFIPDLRIDEFTQLLNEATSACYVHFKGVSNAKTEQRARHQRVRQQNNRSRVEREEGFGAQKKNSVSKVPGRLPRTR